MGCHALLRPRACCVARGLVDERFKLVVRLAGYGFHRSNGTHLGPYGASSGALGIPRRCILAIKVVLGQAKLRRGSTRPTDDPVRFAKRFRDVNAFGVRQCLDIGARRALAGIRGVSTLRHIPQNQGCHGLAAQCRSRRHNDARAR